MAAGMRGLMVVTVFVVAAVGADLQGKSAASLRTNGVILKQPSVDQQLVVCNAYTSVAPLEVFHVQRLNSITGNEPLKYKGCREFTVPLAEGDQLDFKTDGLEVGTFYANGLPKNSARLLLIPRRRDDQAAAIKFESHAFTDLQSTQIAVIDAYQGKQEAAVKISEVPAVADSTGRMISKTEEALKFSSVVAVNPGKYQISLAGVTSDTRSAGGLPLLVEDHAKCVVLRVGSDLSTNGGYQYPQELVVFSKSSSLGQSLGLVALLLCLFTSSL